VNDTSRQLASLYSAVEKRTSGERDDDWTALLIERREPG
jgi:hypothetical protein